MNISKIDFHNFLYLISTLIFCSMLTITSANSQEEYKYRYKAEGVILHKNVQVPEEPKDPCLTGEIGTVCETDGAVYVGEIAGVRRYAASNDLPGKRYWGLYQSEDRELIDENDFETLNPSIGNTDDGEILTSILTPSYDEIQGQYRVGTAAMDCRNELGSEWYLPAINELRLITGNRYLLLDFISGFSNGDSNNDYYMTSNIYGVNEFIRGIRIKPVHSASKHPGTQYHVRCFRKGLEE
ncbi:hypothetical protein [Thalassospira profundimaris]|uniref:hypothetical protein n=1 Tax=Thalassospira profundimaris TaxID=502049 RepID=UPI0011BE2915|nr:hypothetical protein [Thalassospira profundimaris]